MVEETVIHLNLPKRIHDLTKLNTEMVENNNIDNQGSCLNKGQVSFKKMEKVQPGVSTGMFYGLAVLRTFDENFCMK